MAKTPKKQNDSEVLELEAEEIPLEQVIDNTLVKHNVTEAVIHGLKEKYGELRLKAIDDKESYLEVCEARKEVRKYGILAEKICKAGREKANREQKLWLGKQAEVLGKIAEVQDPLDSEINKYEREQERKELEAAQRREDAYMQRQHQLLKLGATYENGSFVLNHISYEATLIKESDDDIWNDTILPKYQKEYEKNESERVDIEKKREEEMLAMKKQQEDMDRQRKELEEQQKQFREQQEQATKIIQEQKRQKLHARANQLVALGMTFNFQYDAYVFEDIRVDNKTEVGLWSDKEWDELIEKIAPIIEDKKADLEVKRLEKIAEEKRLAEEIAVQKERSRIAEEQRQAKIKEEQEAQRKAEEAEKATDKQKWEGFIGTLISMSVPTMKHPAYKSRIESAKALINKITNL